MNFEADLYKAIGKHIRLQRQKAKFTQSGLAKKVGLTRTSITNIENGSQKIQLHNLYSIANVFNLPVDSFLPKIDVNSVNLRDALPLELKPNERKWILNLMKKKRRSKYNENEKKDRNKKLGKITSPPR